MSILSFDVNKNHIFFLLIFISYSIREIVLEIIDDYNKKKKLEYTFGNTKKATKKLFNIYIYTLSNFFSIVCIIIIKINTRRKFPKSDTLKPEQISDKQVKYIYTGGLPINENRLLIRTLMVAICDFIAQYIVFISYLLINSDNKVSIKDKLDFLCIINISAKYFFSMIILKTRYYKHHYLSFIINLFCLILLAVFELKEIKYDKYVIIYLLVRIFSQLSYSLENVIGKIALIKEFLSPYSLLLYKGIYETIILLLFSIPFFFIKKNDVIIFKRMIGLINDPLQIVLYFISMILNFAYNIFIWIIIDRFSPNDCAMAMVIEGMIEKIFVLKNNKEFKAHLFILSFIIYFILIIGICIHSEIIIINKYDLNENTKSRLGTKGEEDFELTIEGGRTTSFESLNEKDNNQNKFDNRLSTNINYKKRNSSQELNPKIRKLTHKMTKLKPLFDENENIDEED